MRIQGPISRHHRIDEHRSAGPLQDTPSLPQSSRHVLPVVGGETTEHGVEIAVIERQLLGGGLTGNDVAQTAFGGGRGDGVKHVWGHVAGDDLRHQGRGPVADMTAAASQVQHPGGAETAQFGLDLVELGHCSVRQRSSVAT